MARLGVNCVSPPAKARRALGIAKKNSFMAFFSVLSEYCAEAKGLP
jgi:hypothetical protein